MTDLGRARSGPGLVRRVLVVGAGISGAATALRLCELDVPVVPVAIDGAQRALTPGHLVPRLLARVSISYLDPIRPAASETLEEFNRRVRDSIAAELARGRG